MVGDADLEQNRSDDGARGREKAPHREQFKLDTNRIPDPDEENRQSSAKSVSASEENRYSVFSHSQSCSQRPDRQKAHFKSYISEKTENSKNLYVQL